jgi:hypothetical protein
MLRRRTRDRQQRASSAARRQPEILFSIRMGLSEYEYIVNAFAQNSSNNIVEKCCLPYGRIDKVREYLAILGTASVLRPLAVHHILLIWSNQNGVQSIHGRLWLRPFGGLHDAAIEGRPSKGFHYRRVRRGQAPNSSSQTLSQPHSNAAEGISPLRGLGTHPCGSLRHQKALHLSSETL